MANHHASNHSRRRVGNASFLAALTFAAGGLLFGAAAAYVGELGAAASTAQLRVANANTSSPPPLAADRRDALVRRVVDRFPLERFAAPEPARANGDAKSEQAFAIRADASRPVRPKIVIILDDIGLDIYAADAAFSLPGPVTYSILPYARDAQLLAAMAEAGEGDVMLHLPMEPYGDEDPGPNALSAEMTGGVFFRSLDWNLSQFKNYVGVNNHMGSKLTTDSAAMKFVIDYLKNRDLFFIDSITTGDSVAYNVGVQMGAKVLRRDVFLDPAPGDRDLVRLQLRLTEQIAIETGYAIAIGHPRPETLAVLGPWLATAEARGFELTTPSALLSPPKPTLVASNPGLRG